MSRGVSDKITFKPYSQEERWLLPPSLDEFIPQNHFVRTVSKTVDELNIEKIFAKYTRGGGASRYNPVMFLEESKDVKKTEKSKTAHEKTFDRV